MAIDGFWTADLEATVLRMNQTVLQFSTAAARPAAVVGQKGMFHIATDTLVLSYDNGGTWVILGSVVALTTKGDITTFSTLPIRKGVGANDAVLKADSTQTDGLIWEKVVHSELTSIGTDDHHVQSHSLASHSSEAHSELTGVTVDQHHTQSHTIGSHSDGSGIARIATGTYTGDGTTDQNITGLGFQPKLVWISKRYTGSGTFGAAEQIWTSDVVVDDNATGSAITVGEDGSGNVRIDVFLNAIITLDADGFSVDDNGVDSAPNKNGESYNFWAIG